MNESYNFIGSEVTNRGGILGFRGGYEQLKGPKEQIS